MGDELRSHVSGTTTVRPVTTETWPDLVQLFTARGGPHYCFCTPYRVTGRRHVDAGEREAVLRDLVGRGTPVGVLAYDGAEPVGWCSVAPRESYARLARSRTMPRATPPESPTWTVLCFFVPRAARGRGLTRVLLDAAVDYARHQGAKVIEGYPFDTAGISATHRGHSSVFAAAGFTPDGRRWARTLNDRALDAELPNAR